MSRAALTGPSAALGIYCMTNTPPTQPNKRGPFVTFETQEFTHEGGWMNIYANMDDLRERLIKTFRDYYEVDVNELVPPPTLEQLIERYFELHSSEDHTQDGIRPGIMVMMELVHGQSAPNIWKNPNCGGGRVVGQEPTKRHLRAPPNPI